MKGSILEDKSTRAKYLFARSSENQQHMNFFGLGDRVRQVAGGLVVSLNVVICFTARRVALSPILGRVPLQTARRGMATV